MLIDQGFMLKQFFILKSYNLDPKKPSAHCKGIDNCATNACQTCWLSNCITRNQLRANRSGQILVIRLISQFKGLIKKFRCKCPYTALLQWFLWPMLKEKLSFKTGGIGNWIKYASRVYLLSHNCFIPWGTGLFQLDVFYWHVTQLVFLRYREFRPRIFRPGFFGHRLKRPPAGLGDGHNAVLDDGHR